MPPTRQSLARGPLPTPVFLMLVSLAEGEAHGYRIRQQVVDRSGGSIRLDPGSLYRLIARLVEEGLIDEAPASAPARRAGGDERRRYYRLTPRGRRVLAVETDRLAGLVQQARAAAKRPRHA